jgi:uncharacterized lipoprotein YajG
MGKRARLLCGLIMILLPALPLTGCDNPPWESGMVLALKVDTPKNGTTVTTSPVTVSGRVNGTQASVAKVSINGTDVPVKDRKFSGSVNLSEGKNAILVVATGGGATLNHNATVTYKPAD